MAELVGDRGSAGVFPQHRPVFGGAAMGPRVASDRLNEAVTGTARLNQWTPALTPVHGTSLQGRPAISGAAQVSAARGRPARPSS